MEAGGGGGFSSAVTGTALPAAQRACGCRLAAQRGGFAGAHQLGGGEPGPGFPG